MVERGTVEEDGTVVKRCVREAHVYDGGTATSFHYKKKINPLILVYCN